MSSKLAHKHAVTLTLDGELAPHPKPSSLYAEYAQRQSYQQAELALANVARSIEYRAEKQKERDPAVAERLEYVPLLTGELKEHIKDLHKSRLQHERALEKLAMSHPLWKWVEGVRGVGPLSLAQILAEAGGELTNYPTPAKLWKRFGVGVIEGRAQGRVKDKDMAIKMGFDPTRRAVIFNVSECLIRANNEVYRAIFDEYKARQLEKGLIRIHAHKRALRYIGKQFLKHLWQASRVKERV